jgi:sepiapterin reductase
MDTALFIITGASKGFGREIAKNLAHSKLLSDSNLICLLGRDMAGLQETASLAKSTTKKVDFNLKECDYFQLRHDWTFDDILGHLEPQFTRVFVFNNAGTLGKLDRISNLLSSDIVPAMFTNVIGPMCLSSAVLKKFPNSQVFVINSSSLAAIQPFDTWSVYCSSKAAIEMFHRTIAIEDPKIRVLNYAPGPMDTDMQAQIRKEMPQVELKEAFVSMHNEGKLVDPAASAKKLLSIIEQNTFDNGSHIDYFD